MMFVHCVKFITELFRTFNKMSKYKERAKEKQKIRSELSGLDIKIGRLRAFIWDNEEFKKLNQVDSILLSNQLYVMRQYGEILETRLDR